MLLATATQEKIFNRLLSKPSNLRCADCGAKSPTWASIDFGVFVCLNCSGAHRALGPSVTRVRSTKLDTWQTAWIQFMQTGNDQCNSFWEYRIGLAKKPSPSSPLDEIKRFVFDKYVKKKYVKDGETDQNPKLKIGVTGDKSSPNQPHSAGMPSNKNKNTSKSPQFMSYDNSDSVKSNNGSGGTKQKRTDDFDFFGFDEAPATNLTTANSHNENASHKTHVLDFNTISHGSHQNNHLSNFLNLDFGTQGHQAAKMAHHVNHSFSHSINQLPNNTNNTNNINNINNHSNHQFSDVFSTPLHTPSIPQNIQFNSVNTQPSFDIFGTKPVPQQQPSLNINMYVNTINFNFVDKKVEEKKDPFHALNEFGF